MRFAPLEPFRERVQTLLPSLLEVRQGRRDLTGTSGLFDKAVVDRAACGLGCDLGLFDKKATDWRAVGSGHLSGPSFAVVVGGSGAGAGLWGYVYSACTTCA